MQSALLLAEAGHQVYLVDPSPGIGGSMHLLDRTFPTDSCGICHMIPGRAAYCPTIECDLHPNIEILPYAEVAGLDGEPGAFSARIHHKPRYVLVDKCIDCSLCVDVCPEVRPSKYEGELHLEKAIYRPPLRAVPGTYVIDMEACSRCGKCVEVCPTAAIDLDMEPKDSTIQTGAVILSPGFEPFDARLKGEFGFGHWDNVLTSLQFERMVSFAGSTGAHLVRPSDGEMPRRIAFIQCVGSRDVSVDKGYCSSVCCMHTAKQVKVAKQLEPELDVTVFFMDIRAHGKDFDEYFNQVESLPGVNYKRSMVSTVHQVQQTRNLLLSFVAEDGSLHEEEFDLVVLVVGFASPQDVQELGNNLGVELNEHGFAVTNTFDPDQSSRPGLFVGGSFREPKDIPETVVEASAAAASASRLLRHGVPTEVPSTTPAVEPRDISEEWPRIGVFFGDSDGMLAEALDLAALAEHARSLPNVELAQMLAGGFSSQGLEEVSQAIQDSDLNRIVLAGKTSLRMQTAFDRLMLSSGLGANLLEQVNLHSEAAWAHPGDGLVANQKARRLVEMAVVGAVRKQPVASVADELNQRVLVIGGGLAGMTAASTLSELGHPVDLVERSDKLGGQLHELHMILGKGDPQEELVTLIERVGAQPRIRVMLQTEVASFSGRLGQFRVGMVNAGEESMEAVYGAVIVATGGVEVSPTEYLYGQDPRVVTQREFEKMIAEGKALPDDIVMIQCVGSREPERPYCSRLCCTKAIVNGLEVKERSPDARITVLYREIRAYGFREDAYREAREKGISFLRYDLEHKPEVELGAEALNISLAEPIAGQRVAIPAGLLVLSTGIAPNPNQPLADVLGSELDAYGFIKEEHTKMRPLDLPTRGVYVCGLAHSPRAVDETIAMAKGAAMRAASLLAAGRMEAQRTIAQVNMRLCSACGLCVDACPYEARVLELGGPYAEVLETVCQGCGVCVAVCPNGASQQVGFALSRVYDMLDAATAE
jgi:heterodisulfide reductase subunit A